ncbi:mitochondrial intermembrane space import and assembly protein 40-B [Microplitis mediator]|uniref:mitochondrial intermembrane space import and assembly protein 40-B n=1 Tax=Microplitis mediator TaxID=375433 RepID=UPI0025550667|nr:mitochondrial intermembrane space import and assembly protein 40-B [Microplitis mediator]
MSIINKIGKDTIIFATKEDHSSPSKIHLPKPEPSPGLLLPNGEINWNCPCLGGMATGPCGLEFRDAFSCFHYSTAEPKGSDCYEAFKVMQACMTQYPALYGNKDSQIDDIDMEDQREINAPKSQDDESNFKSRLSINQTTEETMPVKNTETERAAAVTNN